MSDFAAKQLKKRLLSELPDPDDIDGWVNVDMEKVNAVLRASGYDPDELGRHFQAVADRALQPWQDWRDLLATFDCAF